ncbi:MAG: gliding motility-associated C-terminal domain-containing protein [Bacteroidetes bacterium]|nr:gliding motility-associated C-terminal domain-containing protein [Bacteroidota bacterium]
MKKLLTLLVLIQTAFLHAQVANDDCFGAQNLGSLGTPAPCPSGLGAVMTVNNLTNVNSVTEQPYTTLINCQPTNNTPMASPATDVWYAVTVTGNELIININGNISTPNVAVYQGNCAGLVGRGCAIGSGGTLSASFDQMVPGNTYYIQISGGTPADQGTFTMTLQNNNSCDDCLLASNLTVNPAPVNGTYQGGTTVTFCYTITQWDQQNTNWLHAVIPTFGNGWDLSTLTNLQPANTCDNGPGVWQWFNNVNTPNGNGIMSGFFFDGDVVQGGPNGNPADNFGDNCDGQVNWQFCWTITAKDCPPGNTGDDLGIIINTFGDGETGNWTNIACVGDPVYQFNASLSCCMQPLMQMTAVDCYGNSNGSVTATAQGVGPFDYVWTDAGNTVLLTQNGIPGPSTLNTLPAGVYTVQVTDNNDGCVTTQSITVTQPTALQLLVGSTSASCNQNDGTATVTPQGGTGPYDFIWTDAANVTIQTANNLNGANTANNLAAGSYSCQVTDANGCVANVNIPVAGNNGNINVAFVTTDASCFGICDASATATPAGGTAPYDFSWTDANNVVIGTATNQNTHALNALCGGTYTLLVTDANGCTDTQNVQVNEPPQVTALLTAAPQTICIGQTTTLTGTPGGGSGGPYTFNWSPVVTGSGAVVTDTPNATTTYTLVVRDINGCAAAPVTITVTVYPPLSAQLSANPAAVCVGQPSTLTAVPGGGNGGPYTYTWLPAGTGGNSATATVNPAVTTTYTVIVDDGCTTPTASATVTVTVNPPPTVSFTGTPLNGCAPLQVVFTNTSTAANNPNCFWDFGDGFTSANCNPTHIYTATGCFDVTLTYTDDNGCQATTVMPGYVCANPSAVADFSFSPVNTTVLNPTVNFTDLSTGATTWTWDFDQLGSSTDQNPVFTFPSEVAGCYDVQLIANNTYNCPDTSVQEVCVLPEFIIYFPNAFTPNADGENEFFTGYGIGIATFELYIFDRWGNMIYFTDDMNQGWDGRVKGQPDICMQDVYVWKCKVVDVLGQKHAYIGHVTLIR